MPSEEGIEMLQAMGFTRPQCVKALQSTDNNVERAADWIFSHPDEINSIDDDVPVAVAAPPTEFETTITDGAPGIKLIQKLILASNFFLQFFFVFSVYELAAFISHMGTSTHVGHYVCHIKKDGRWVIFNDEKVALSENPPFELGYLYLYRRLSQQ